LAFDVVVTAGEIDLKRNLELFEGKDSYGRFQPVLATATHEYTDPR
jgi:hypothetical protein